ncbi:MAG: MBL fold metallo-hydrolase [Desulfovibrio sp.]|uniref:MBL fold metallo-hydrolase RNA specificity domain-containing protein n=1 Tax=Desulfovibrio sp. TaxID=885 RepID=UPI001A6E8660|nr:MBL fold metallo-hydrolase [Desulfovibrio sp.]MBD5417757.1 MBL fold metallo-hydrolase [Desulfovibrio sp.]
MKIQFLGAARTVTGSCHMIEAAGSRFSIDCGMHQGNRTIEARNRNLAPYRPRALDFVILTHAHMDHAGLLPALAANGFKGPIYCTTATADLLGVMLEDSAHIQEMEAEREAKKFRRRGLKHPPAPLYTVEDARKAAALLRPVDYHAPFEPAPGVRAVLHDAGHILGSGTVRLEVEEGGALTSLIFSGDIGRPDALIVRDPETPPAADYVFMESTYGDRNHKNEGESEAELAAAIAWAHGHGEKVIIPAFAVERSQEVLYCLLNVWRSGGLPDDMPIFLDSPLAIRATEIFTRHGELFDEAARALYHDADAAAFMARVQYTLSAQESMRINALDGPAIVISASGMCNAGRIRHHLRHNLWRPGASVVFVGYQAQGTPGRRLVEKAASLRLFGEEVACAARIFTINGFSGHAGQSQLLDWLAPLAGETARRRPQVVLVHGEPRAQAALGALIKERFDITPLSPDYLEQLTLQDSRVAGVEHHEEARPPVDLTALTKNLERKLALLREKAAAPRDEQAELSEELSEALARLDGELTRLLGRM